MSYSRPCSSVAASWAVRPFLCGLPLMKRMLIMLLGGSVVRAARMRPVFEVGAAWACAMDTLSTGSSSRSKGAAWGAGLCGDPVRFRGGGSWCRFRRHAGWFADAGVVNSDASAWCGFVDGRDS